MAMLKDLLALMRVLAVLVNLAQKFQNL